MYLIDTQVISEASEKDRVNPGVTGFTSAARARGDRQQAALLDTCLDGVLDHHRNPIFAFDGDAAQVWDRARVAHSGHELDKQIAAIALVNAPTVVTRNAADLVGTGVDLLHPFVGA